MGTFVDRLRNPLAMAAYYEVRVGTNKTLINEWVVGDVSVTEEADFIRTATFSVKGAKFVDVLSRLTPVTIYGGSQDPNNQRYLFKGIIKRIDHQFNKSGVPQLNVTCYGGAYRGAKQDRKIIYPSPKCERTWADSDKRDSIKLSEIVNNILNESFYQFNCKVDIQPENDHVFTYSPNGYFVQTGTDWQALKDLARIGKCIFAEKANDSDTGEHNIIFVDRERYANETDSSEKSFPMSFRYLERSIENDNDFIRDFLRDGEISVDQVNFNMDVDLNSGSLRIVSDFNEGGDGKTYLQKYDEKSDKILLYELKPTEYFNKLSDYEVDYFWRRLTNDFDNVKFEEIQQFFLPLTDEKNNTVAGYEDNDVGMQGAGPLGFVGYEINVTLIGDKRVEPYRYYPIFGIGKYSSKEDGGNKYYLRSLVHRMGANGYIQELNFYR